MTEWACPECDCEVAEPKRRGPHVAACRRTKNARYIYRDADRKHSLRPIICASCGQSALGRSGAKYCSTACSQTGEHNSVWRGDSASYIACHQRVYRRKGPAFGCSQCGTREERHYEWANLTGNYPDPEDYSSMCKPCHARYDIARRKGGQ